MNRRNWLDLSRKLVDRFDLDYTVAAVAASQGQQSLAAQGKGIFNSLAHLNSLYCILSGSNLSVNVLAGEAYDANGQPTVVPTTQNQVLTSDGTNPKKSLLVLRYFQVGDTPVPKPSDPILTVNLNLVDSFQIFLRDGTPAPSPVYPATVPGDLVLRGITIPALATLGTQCTLDFSVADFALQAIDTFDNRLLPMLVANPTVAIKPSQTFGQSPQKFTFAGLTRPSAFPLNSGVFNDQDTLLNFQTGAISGGDTTSSPFTPTIPAAGQSIVASVRLKTDDTLDVSYGTQGTLAQCLAAITNQSYAGAGSLAALKNFLQIAYVVLTSSDGINITATQVKDARSFGAYKVSSNLSNRTTTIDDLTVADDVVLGDSTGASFNITLPSAVGITGKQFWIKFKSPTTTNTVTINTTAGQLVDNRPSGDIVLARHKDFLYVESDGANWVILGKKETSFLTANSSSSVGVNGSDTFNATGASQLLGIGQWRIHGKFAGFGGVSASNVFLNSNSGFFGANGTGTGTPPTALTGVVDGDLDYSGFTSILGTPLLLANSQVATTTPLEIVLSLDTPTTIWLVANVHFATAGGSAYGIQITAERIW